VDISTPSPALHAVRPRNTRRSWARRMIRLAVLAGSAAILAGFVFSPVAFAATGDFIITGRGYGQGVGMSQWGMWQGAREGNTYPQILAFYYPGTTLTTISAVNPARQTITVRITTGVDTFTTVKLTAMVTPATLADSTGATIQTLAVGESVTLVYSGAKAHPGHRSCHRSLIHLRRPQARLGHRPGEGHAQRHLVHWAQAVLGIRAGAA
jgi:hypothetical protein